jgi:hypothetical protein
VTLTRDGGRIFRPMSTGSEKPMLPADLPCIAADFNALVTACPHRVLLDTHEARCDLEEQGLELRDGLRALYRDPDANERGEPDAILCAGTVRNDAELGWVAYLDGDRVMWESDWAQR